MVNFAELVSLINQGKAITPDMKAAQDAHAVASVMKAYLQQLPDEDKLLNLCEDNLGGRCVRSLFYCSCMPCIHLNDTQ